MRARRQRRKLAHYVITRADLAPDRVADLARLQPDLHQHSGRGAARDARQGVEDVLGSDEVVTQPGRLFDGAFQQRAAALADFLIADVQWRMGHGSFSLHLRTMRPSIPRLRPSWYYSGDKAAKDSK